MGEEAGRRSLLSACCASGLATVAREQEIARALAQTARALRGPAGASRTDAVGPVG